MLDKLLTELKKPLSKTHYTYLCIFGFLAMFIIPFTSHALSLVLITPFLLQLFILFITARRLSGLDTHLAFSAITLIPTLGIFFCIYLCIADKKVIHGHIQQIALSYTR